MKKGIILLAHGSRDPMWSAPIEAVENRIKAHTPQVLVCCAYLELTAPSLLEAASELIAKGASSIRIFPLFLGIGKHARTDIPVLMSQLTEQHPTVAFELLVPAGECAELTELLAQLAIEPAPTRSI